MSRVLIFVAWVMDVVADTLNLITVPIDSFGWDIIKSDYQIRVKKWLETRK